MLKMNTQLHPKSKKMGLQNLKKIFKKMHKKIFFYLDANECKIASKKCVHKNVKKMDLTKKNFIWRCDASTTAMTRLGAGACFIMSVG